MSAIIHGMGLGSAELTAHGMGLGVVQNAGTGLGVVQNAGTGLGLVHVEPIQALAGPLDQVFLGVPMKTWLTTSALAGLGAAAGCGLATRSSKGTFWGGLGAAAGVVASIIILQQG